MTRDCLDEHTKKKTCERNSAPLLLMVKQKQVPFWALHSMNEFDSWLLLVRQ
jgi:hypothetical protein